MENYEYSKVFPFEDGETDALDPDGAETMGNSLNIFEWELKDRTYFLLPFAPAFFQKTVADCERIAKEFFGRIKAKIDYTLFTATIELWCFYVEFERGEFMNILHDISNYAVSVRFTPLTSGELHIEIQMPYFATAQDFEESD